MKTMTPAETKTPILAKLAVSRVGDTYEQEADRIAGQVMRMPQPVSSAETASAPRRSVIQDASSLHGGQPLSAKDLRFFEPRFGQDFSEVRVHTDERAAQSSASVQARAYTYGRDMVFGAGQYAPETQSGRRLIAHELTHIVQQNFAPNPVRGRLQRAQLTYDDGPDREGATRSILESLNGADARATFYLVGKRIAQGDNWRTVFDIAAAGHLLGNHAYDWNDTTNNHQFLSGGSAERAEKILWTEWAIRDALIRGRAEARASKTWDKIPPASRDYIEDVIAHGTGRFRTPGFRSKAIDPRLSDSMTGSTTRAGIATANQVLSASGLRSLAVTDVPDFLRITGVHEGVTVDPEDWRRGKTAHDIETGVAKKLHGNSDSILLHSRIAATAAATPAVVANMQVHGMTFDPAVQGGVASMSPEAGFADLPKISNPPAPSEIAAARMFLQRRMLGIGPNASGKLAVGILQLAQRAGGSEVDAFLSEIRGTVISTPEGEIPMATWMNASPEWKLFAVFYENWRNQAPFPRVKGVTL